MTSFEQSLAILEKVKPPVGLRIAKVQGELGQALILAGKPTEAEVPLAKALAEFRRLRGDSSVEVHKTAALLVGLYQAQGNTRSAEALKGLLDSEK